MSSPPRSSPVGQGATALARASQPHAPRSCTEFGAAATRAGATCAPRRADASRSCTGRPMRGAEVRRVRANALTGQYGPAATSTGDVGGTRGRSCSFDAAAGAPGPSRPGRAAAHRRAGPAGRARRRRRRGRRRARLRRRPDEHHLRGRAGQRHLRRRHRVRDRLRAGQRLRRRQVPPRRPGDPRRRPRPSSSTRSRPPPASSCPTPAATRFQRRRRQRRVRPGDPAPRAGRRHGGAQLDPVPPRGPADPRRDEQGRHEGAAGHRRARSTPPTSTTRTCPTTACSPIPINKLTNARIVQGLSDGTFRPGTTVTRGQLAQFVAKGIEETHRQAHWLPTLTDPDWTTLRGTLEHRRVSLPGPAGGQRAAVEARRPPGRSSTPTTPAG